LTTFRYSFFKILLHFLLCSLARACNSSPKYEASILFSFFILSYKFIKRNLKKFENSWALALKKGRII